MTDLITRCARFADRAPGKPRLAIAVVDSVGNALGVYRMKGLGADKDGVVDPNKVDIQIQQQEMPQLDFGPPGGSK